MVRWLCEGARGGGERRQQEVRGLRPEAPKLRAVVGCEEEAVVRRLRSEGGKTLWQQDVRGLPAEQANLRTASRSEKAVVLWLREGARGGGER